MERGEVMGVRRQAREAAIQALFMCDFISDWDVSAAEFCLDHFSVSPAVRPYAGQLCKGALENVTKIDAKLTVASEHWSLNRMARVDRSILRIATYELMFLDEVPINVSINEAIEIAKRFGSDESPQFVNGVLDRVASLVRNRLKVEVVKAPEVSAIEADLEVAGIADIPLSADKDLAEDLI